MDWKVIAEIGCNHQGRVALAAKMIRRAAKCGVWGVKFQKRNPLECLGVERYHAPYTSPHSFGATYGEHRERLELTVEDHAKLMKLARTLGLKYGCSVWDETSIKEMADLKVDWLKVPSAHNEDEALLHKFKKYWSKPVHLSNGMCTRWGEGQALSILNKPVLYACTSSYPAEDRDVKILDVRRIMACYGSRVSSVGFSGHHRGIVLDIAAATLGAEYIERHFTTDRSMKGTDQAASLDPNEMASLVRNLKTLKAAWHTREGILVAEKPVVDKIKKVTRVKAGRPVKA